jgi:hypothetical protein
VLKVQNEQVVKFAPMLGVSMETRDLNGALLSSCALMVFPLRVSLFGGTMQIAMPAGFSYRAKTASGNACRVCWSTCGAISPQGRTCGT